MVERKGNGARERFIIYLMTFIMGGCGIAYEYTFSKISSDLMGNSVRQWAITIGLMMFFMGIGSDLQKHIKDEGLFDKFILFEILLGLIGAFGPIVFLFCFGYFREHYVMVQYLATISVGFLIGLEIPILTRINEDFTPELKVNIGGVLRMDYVGAFLGALLWVFVLPRFFSLTQMSFVLGIFNLITAALALAWFHHLAVNKKLMVAITTAGIAALVIGLVRVPDWSAHAEQKLFLDKIIYKNTTRYQHIVLTETASNDIYCYINGNTQFSSYDEHIYHEFLVHPAMTIATRRKNVLVLGGGDGLAVREILKYPDVETITLVDLDPGMTDLAMTHPSMVRLNRGSLLDGRVKVLANNALAEPTEKREIILPDRTTLLPDGQKLENPPEVYIVNLDAALFVQQISGIYDVIIIDFPDPSNLELAKLYSQGFYTNVVDKLSRDGILVQQSTSPVFAREAFLCVGRTMNASGLTAVPFHEHVPTFGEWGWWIAHRSDAPFPQSLKERLINIETIEPAVRYITPDLVRASLAFGKEELVTEKTEINTIMNNVIFRFY